MKFEELYERIDGSGFNYKIGMKFRVVKLCNKPVYKIIDRYKYKGCNTYEIKKMEYGHIVEVSEVVLDRDIDRNDAYVIDWS